MSYPQMPRDTIIAAVSRVKQPWSDDLLIDKLDRREIDDLAEVILQARFAPYPIETAPAGDGWILGLVDHEGAEVCQRQPWMIVTRCDDGWCDDDGYHRAPRAWMPLPDPQPRGTGWRPSDG